MSDLIEQTRENLQLELDSLFDKKQELTNEIELYEEDDTTREVAELASVEADISRVITQIEKLEKQDEH